MNDRHRLQWLKQMRAIGERKSTQELLAVWQRNDRLQWTDDAFTVIGEILAARLGHAPPQQDQPPAAPRRRPPAAVNWRLLAPRPAGRPLCSLYSSSRCCVSPGLATG